ncbi:hypothetical protein Sjap_019343 [Stephania japonica]|uniref:Uncharacterized protein n=1 Tax=Stephania japonica TaxID=461633 RepID=A0AAP0HZM6_9MAGN
MTILSSLKLRANNWRRSCLCAPTTHPGSFRCSLHRNPPCRFGAHHDEMNPKKATNLLKEFLRQTIKPSSHDLHRRRDFRPKPTRFCLMNNGSSSSTTNRALAVS